MKAVQKKKSLAALEEHWQRHQRKQKGKKGKDNRPSLEALFGKKKEKRKRKTAQEGRLARKEKLEKAGFLMEPKDLEYWFLRVTVGVVGAAVLYFLILVFLKKLTVFGFLTYTLGLTFVGGPVVYLAIWLIVYFLIDYRIFFRTKEVEDVLPEYLELCALNVKAGMSIDRALWFSVRPKFGVLAQEMEMVAKRTLTGEDLNSALRDLVSKFNSPVLQRTISLIIEGIEAGGEIGVLLHNISEDLQESKILRKEMASSVTTYVIFITFASIVAAPGLMALSYHLLRIIQGFATRLDPGAGGGAASSFSISPDAIILGDYKIFAMISLSITAFFSAAIISTIQHGNIKEGLRYIPIFIGWSLFLFLVGIRILSTLLGGILQQ